MHYGKLRHIPLVKNLYKKTILPRARIKMDRIQNYLKDEKKVLDVGCGNGGLSFLMQQAGYEVTSLDIRDLSYYESVRPVIYTPNGVFPFPDKSFDLCMIITVLHHIPEHDPVIKEAIRVARKVLIIEDVYQGKVMEKATHWMDSLVNMEFAGHPHTNRTHEGWMNYFQKYPVEVKHLESYPVLGIFEQSVYLLHT